VRVFPRSRRPSARALARACVVTACAVIACVVATGAALTGVARAGTIDPVRSTAYSDEGTMWICPRGDGNLAAWTVPSGIVVHLLDHDGAPCADIPRQDVWLTSTTTTLAFCQSTAIADSDTDPDGFTSFSHASPPGGGCDHNELAGGQLDLKVVAMGATISSSIPLSLNSPDINGDLLVNLADVGPFSLALNGAYSFCADFWPDGLINLTDVAILSAHLGHACL
jgi:hypothetical protein